MSSIFQTVFGGSKSKGSETSTSYNKSYDTINNAFSPLLGNAQTGSDALLRLLSGDASGFNAYKDATGFDAAAEAGSRGITGNAAASGLLRSGSTGKALTAFGNNIQNQWAGNYMDRLLGLANTGFQAGNAITAAGDYSYGQGTKSSSEKPGISKFIGAAMASDRRLKKNVFKLGEMSDGLGVYRYHYIDGRGPYIGVMADEVEKLRPAALGPEIDGYKTVHYGKLMEGVRE